MYRALRSVLFLVAPERVHTWVFALLRAATATAPLRGALTRWLAPRDPILATTVFGVRFPGPVGLADICDVFAVELDVSRRELNLRRDG